MSLLSSQELATLKQLVDDYCNVYGDDWGVVHINFGKVTVGFYVLGRQELQMDYLEINQGFWANFFGRDNRVPLKADGPWWDEVRKGMPEWRKHLNEEKTRIEAKKAKRLAKMKERLQ